MGINTCTLATHFYFMNDAHLHLLINHFPIIGPILGLLILIAGFVFKNIFVKRTALGVLIVSSLMAFPANFTGEEAEHMVEEIPGISHNTIEEHEEAAEIFILAAGLLAVLSLLTLIIDLKKLPAARILYVVVLLAAIVVVVLAAQAGTTGGKIRHPEIEEGFQKATPTQNK